MGKAPKRGESKEENARDERAPLGQNLGWKPFQGGGTLGMQTLGFASLLGEDCSERITLYISFREIDRKA